MATAVKTKSNISVNGNGRLNGLPKKPAKVVWEYAKSPESKDHIQLKPQYDLFIGGKWVKSKKYFDTINPSNEERLSSVASASKEDVNKAVNSAERAFNNVWSKISAKERAKYIFRIARIMQEKAREFAVIESMDGGKPIKESKGVDVPLALQHFFYYAGWAPLRSGLDHHWIQTGLPLSRRRSSSTTPLVWVPRPIDSNASRMRRWASGVSGANVSP